jgi:hypothetical protein
MRVLRGVVAVYLGGTMVISCTASKDLGSPIVEVAKHQPPDQIKIQWTYPTDAATPRQFQIVRDGDVVATVDGSHLYYIDKDVWPATKYEYSVSAASDSENGPVSPVVTVSTSAPPLSEARLVGKFTIEPVVRASNLKDVHPGKPLGSYQVSFEPSCKSGPCGGQWTHIYISTNGGFHAVNHGTFTKRQKTYLANLVRASLSWCDATGTKILSHRDSAQYQIRVAAAQINDQGEWVATRIAGTDIEYDPAGDGCIAGQLSLNFEGKLNHS